MFAKTMRPTNVRASVGSSRSGSSARATVIVPPALGVALLVLLLPVPLLPLPPLVLLPPHAAATRAATTAAATQLNERRMLTPPRTRRSPVGVPTRSECECHAPGWRCGQRVK